MLVATAGLSLTAGCQRGFFRRTADRDAYNIVAEKGAGPTWRIQPGFTIEPDRRSRFYDPTCPTDPSLPVPAPQIHNYALPPLVTQTAEPRELSASNADNQETTAAVGQNANAVMNRYPAFQASGAQPLWTSKGTHLNRIALEPSGTANLADQTLTVMTSTNGNSSGSVSLAKPNGAVSPANLGSPPLGTSVMSIQSLPGDQGHDMRGRAVRPDLATSISSTQVQTASNWQPVVAPSVQLDGENEAATAVAASPTNEGQTSEGVEEVEAVEDPFDEFGDQPILQIPPQPAEAWEALPAACLKRMLEFEDVRREYRRTYGVEVTEDLLDSAPRVTLENILELALINNREYQRQKEALYLAALRLSLTRFDYTLRFSRVGNGVNLEYRNSRQDSLESNRLGIGSGLGIEKSFYTAGDLVARFANDVVLTFGGANGFSSEVGSEIFIDLFQPILQRDVRFEPLIQSERDVVYAAREFVRFRKQLFRNLASDYYGLLLQYRGIAIATQDYFSNLDGFNRAAATYGVGRIPRFQVDQFEQNVLESRSGLVSVCNSVEGSLDRLKFDIGLPPEMPLNLDLSELETLTLSDESTAVREQIRRARDYVLQQIESQDNAVAIPAAAELARRMLNLVQILERLDEAEPGLRREIEILVAQLEAEGKRQEAAENAIQSDMQVEGEGLLPAQIFLRNQAVMRTMLEAIQLKLKLLELINAPLEATNETMETNGEPADLPLPQAGASMAPPVDSPLDVADLPASMVSSRINEFRRRWEQLVTRYQDLSQRADQTPNAEKPATLPRLIRSSEELLREVDALQLSLLEQLEQLGITMTASASDQIQLAEDVATRSASAPFVSESGLRPLEVDVDEAMLTAVVQRLDLMNVRGDLADAWRDIKYSADDLRSVLNIRGEQRLRNDRSNDPFDLNLDGSTTRLSLEFDAPLNRRIERNIFRLALIDYNVALRNVIAAEDSIKLDIRNDLRALELNQNQFEIAIASAALAYERVISTRFQLAFGQGNITARDFLEAQQAYTRSLTQVARFHVEYIVDRIEFFLDLEQLEVDPLNFWPELRNEDYQFIADTEFGSANPRGYGELPCGPWYSKRMLRFNSVPNGFSFNPQRDGSTSAPQMSDSNQPQAESVPAAELTPQQ
ncbi:MAG: TolC family protein [bacterium]|nr:TolC family protein [bacterium]